IVNGHPNSQIDDLLPWVYINKLELKAVAREHRLQCITTRLSWIGTRSAANGTSYMRRDDGQPAIVA
ncbi:hypothetical protein NKG60_26385, partial [Mesorhizobium sp. M1428]|uniref:hypothetical protein n=1 Tax=Mesorhizobium sp. M1428 TaxID=2957102 RepID=UPI003335A91A